MTPFLSTVELTALSPHQRKKICSCDTPCKKGITVTSYNDGMVMCYKDAQKLMRELRKQLNENYRSKWDKDEDQVIIDAYANGTYVGIYKDIARKLKDRSLSQVKNRISYLRRKGIIV